MASSLNETPAAERVHIGLFGCRNAGKSSLINALTGQDLSIVSDFKGTTTDPVSKAMEILPLGPVLITDTPGLDDEGALGEKRVKKARFVLRSTDIALLVVDAALGLSEADQRLLKEFKERKVPYLLIVNKIDIYSAPLLPQAEKDHLLFVSAQTHEGIMELKERLSRMNPTAKAQRPLLGDLLAPGDLVVLVVPIDESAPKARLILPQQQTIREILDFHGRAIVVQPDELPSTVKAFHDSIRLVITDSQAFSTVKDMVPEDVPLTSFSILFARYKGELEAFIEGANELKRLKEGDRVLISEGCTHHRQCNDIGTVKMPDWIRRFSRKTPEFSFTSGKGFPDDLSSFSLIVHCGACMLNPQEVSYRQQLAKTENIPMTNYGIAIAYMNGILRRVLSPFPELVKKVK